jgi:Putative amidoligase enzyme
LSKDQKLHKFSDREAADRSDEWDSTGIEIVTPPMRPNNPISFKEIGQYLKALKGNSESNYGIVTSKYAGVHVHIGFSTDGPRISLLHVIQHLAYILVQFEPLLVKFSPPYRDGGRQGNIICDNDTKSNLTAAINHEKQTFDNNPWLQDLANDIFLAPSIPSIRDLMHYGERHKGYQVNFWNLADAVDQPWNKKSTIEFRLQESTTDAHDIEMWVRLCLALRKAAERQAAKLTDCNGNKIADPTSQITEYSKYKKRNLDDKVTTTDLFDLLDLDDVLRKYWQARWDRYQNDQHMELPMPELDGLFYASASSASSSSSSTSDGSDAYGGPRGDDSESKGKKAPSQSPETPKGEGKDTAQKKNGSLARMGRSKTPETSTKSLEGKTKIQNRGRKRKRSVTLTSGPNPKRVLRFHAQ